MFKTHFGTSYYSEGRRPSFAGVDIFGKILKASAIRQEIVPYDFRHTFASRLRMKGDHLDTIAKLMGYSKLETTQRYAHLHPDYLRSSIEKLSSVA